MIITLIVVGIFITGIICLVISKKTYCGDWVECFGYMATIISFFVLIAVVGAIIGVQVGKDINYQNMLHKKEMLEYRIDNMNDNIVGNEMIYNNIVEFNNELRSVKKWANNPWTNWFNNKDIAAIDYVEIDR